MALGLEMVLLVVVRMGLGLEREKVRMGRRRVREGRWRAEWLGGFGTIDLGQMVKVLGLLR